MINLLCKGRTVESCFTDLIFFSQVSKKRDFLFFIKTSLAEVADFTFANTYFQNFSPLNLCVVNTKRCIYYRSKSEERLARLIPRHKKDIGIIQYPD